MMFKIYRLVEQLPAIWDDIAGDNIFLQRDTLKALERENPCQQSYHLNEEKKISLVSYRLKLNLLTFTKHFSLKLPVNIIGVPMSVAKSGYTFGDQLLLSTYIKSLKGLWLILNADHQLDLSQGQTLPACIMELPWESLNSYLESMRSHYRYRFNKALQRFTDIKIEELEDNRFFDQEMYELYLKVHERSQEKLEKLQIGFFRSFPAKILKFSVEGKVVGFVQLVENYEELIFLFCGFKHDLNQKYDLYLNMLLQIVAYGLENGFKTINFGQTTEATKLKLGARQEPKNLYVHHGNRHINAVLNKLVGRFSYRPYPVAHRVFKEEIR